MNSYSTLDNVAVVIRASGERTEQLCKSLLEDVIPTQNIVVIHESPFSHAVLRTCEIGLSYDLPWTLAVDADVLVDPVKIVEFITLAGQMDTSIFKFNPRIIDKLLYMKRLAGVHLYRTHLLAIAMDHIGSESFTIRPESYLAHQMAEIGHHYQTVDVVVGLHDFEQYYRDLFRTLMTHSIRHPMYLRLLYPFWQELASQDDDYRVVLWAYQTTNLFSVDAKLDAREFLDNMDDILTFLGLSEKSSYIDNITSQTTHEKVTDLSQDKRLLNYTQNLEKIRANPRRSPKYWLFRAGGGMKEIGAYIQKRASQF